MRIDSPRAQLWSWIVMAAVNAVCALCLGRPSGGMGVRLVQIAYDLGQLGAAGLVSATAAACVLRWGPRRRWARYALLWAAAAVVGAVVLPDDLVGLAGPSAPASTAAAAAAAAAVPAAAFAGSKLAAILRPAPFVLGLALQVGNNLAYGRAYLGLHLFALWIGALLVAASLTGWEPPARLARVRVPPRASLGATAALCLFAAASLVRKPPVEALLELYKTPGSGLAPFLARIDLAGAPHVAGEGEWFADRRRLPPVPPSRPLLVGKDPIVLLVTVDAFRHELVEGDAYRDRLPVLHALRDEGAHFRKAKAPSPATVPSIAALFTGRFFSQLYWTEQTGGGRQKLYPHQDDTARLPALLSAGGVRTVVVVSGTGFTPHFGITDEFDHYVDKGSPVGIPAAKITDHIVAELEESAGPTFLYTHYFEPHAPYDRAGKEGTELERYVREVAIVDRELGRLREAIRRLGLADRVVLVVTGDHGEAFGEHGTTGHAVSLYEELIHVPLLVHGAGVRPRAVDELVSLADLGPTALDLFGLPTPAKFMGQSLVPLLRGESVELARPVVAESGRHVQSMYFRDGLKIIADKRMGTVELYDLDADPGETKDLSAERSEVAAERLRWLRAYFGAHAYAREGYTLPYRP